MAFAVVDYVYGEVKNDPKIVKWYALLVDSVDNKKSFSDIPFYERTEKYFANFYEPNLRSSGKVNKYKKSGGFMCLDWKAVELKATDYGPNFKTIDIILLPCSMRETLYGASQDRILSDSDHDQ